MPNWQGGVQAGSSFFATPNVHVNTDVPDVRFQLNGNTGFLESSFNNQVVLPDGGMSTVPNQVASGAGVDIVREIGTSQLSVNGETATPTDSHTIETQPDSYLVRSDMPLVGDASFWETIETNDGKGWSFIDNFLVGISDVHVDRNLSIPGSQGTVPYLDVFDLNKSPFVSLQSLSAITREFSGLIPVSGFIEASALGQGEDQQN